MRSLLLACGLLFLTLSGASAEQSVYRAGIARIVVQDIEPFEAIIWYPAKQAPAATQGVEIADGARFPIVLLSHGRRGSPFGHRQLAAHLAQAGYIVVAPTHIGDASGQTTPRSQIRILMDRPRQAHKALDALLADPRFSQRVDEFRMGMIGFSAGGYTTLVLAGARPDFAHATAYCRDHGDDRGSCGAARGEKGELTAPAGDDAFWSSMREPRLKAIVLMDPLAILFDAAGLASVRVPTLLIRPEHDDYLRAAGNATAVTRGVAKPPQVLVVPGSHFVLLDPCPDGAATKSVAQCTDGPGVDRIAIHHKIEAEILAFLGKAL